MDRNKLYQPAIKAFEGVRQGLLDELAQWDRTIDTIRSNDRSNPAVPVLEEKRQETQIAIDECNHEIERLQNKASGVTVEAGPGEQITPRPGMFENSHNLKTSILSYLQHYPGGGPISIIELAKNLNIGNATTQVRRGPRKGERQDVTATVLKTTIRGWHTGFRSKGLPSPIGYDPDNRGEVVWYKSKVEMDREREELRPVKEAFDRERARLKQAKKGKRKGLSGRERVSRISL